MTEATFWFSNMAIDILLFKSVSKEKMPAINSKEKSQLLLRKKKARSCFKI